MFGTYAHDPFAEGRQLVQDRMAAWNGIKGNLPALGMVMGLSMLANNDGAKSLGQLAGQGGADALDAYGTWRKIEDARQKELYEKQINKEKLEADAAQREQSNALAVKKLALDEAKANFAMDMARRRLGLRGLRDRRGGRRGDAETTHQGRQPLSH